MTLLKWNGELFYLSTTLVGSCELYNFLSWLLNLNKVLCNSKEFCKGKNMEKKPQPKPTNQPNKKTKKPNSQTEW